MQDRLNKLGAVSVVLGCCSFIAGVLGCAAPIVCFAFIWPDEEPTSPGAVGDFEFSVIAGFLLLMTSFGMAGAGVGLAIAENRINSSPSTFSTVGLFLNGGLLVLHVLLALVLMVWSAAEL
ncbi:MAG: hypothetical protein RIC55_09105 [Pirellulaceae bacterium]